LLRSQLGFLSVAEYLNTSYSPDREFRGWQTFWSETRAIKFMRDCRPGWRINLGKRRKKAVEHRGSIPKLRVPGSGLDGSQSPMFASILCLISKAPTHHGRPSCGSRSSRQAIRFRKSGRKEKRGDLLKERCPQGMGVIDPVTLTSELHTSDGVHRVRASPSYSRHTHRKLCCRTVMTENSECWSRFPFLRSLRPYL